MANQDLRHRQFHLQFVRRVRAPLWFRALVLGSAVLVGLALVSLILLYEKKPPLTIYLGLLQGSVADWYSLSETLVQTIPLMLCALGVMTAARLSLWNVGAEGQFFAGAIAASGVALYWGHFLPSYIILPLMVLAGAVAGGLYCLMAAIPRAYLGVNEIITTLLLNYTAILFGQYLLTGLWKDPQSGNFPLTALFARSAQLPRLFGTRIHLGIAFAMVAAVLLYLFLYRTRWGYEIRVAGGNPAAARYAGMHWGRAVLLVMFISGALPGLAGMAQVSGLNNRFEMGISLNYGMVAIIVVWLSGGGPLSVSVVSFLMAALLTGGYSIQTLGVPSSIVGILQGVLLFVVLTGQFFLRYHVRIVRRLRPAVSRAAAPLAEEGD